MSSQLLTFDENYNNDFVAVSGNTEIFDHLNDEFEDFGGKREDDIFIFPKNQKNLVKMFVDGINAKMMSSENKESEEESEE